MRSSMERLSTALRAYNDEPCDTELEFKNLWMLGGSVLTCLGCARVPAKWVFTKAALRGIDDLSITDPLKVRRLLEHYGQCK